MSQVNYELMSDRELKQYLLTHRDDKAAFHAYMDRRHQRQKHILIEAGEIDDLPFNEQVKIVAERLSKRFLQD
ncbi:hypothetical protein HC931_27675 [Candidatus Gracilibacteria bacterium]|jgi:hypothetical protein|nr:hypothetical protein [Candidatus Gracilibacteria bacterium]NJM90460.1 hypothetical protein [Hydrococcus sp. RU_2_2]NJP22287.1 hypothetical protein [Hydrococcus sp. CRU_1_1]